MRKILGIFRGFPGLGRIIAGVSLLETLKSHYGYDVRFISYLQGNEYLKSHGYNSLQDVTFMDYCSIGLLPTNKMGAYIHATINEFTPDIILIDGEPLILQSIKISYPNIKVVALLNPSDVDNPYNDREAMDFFNAMYSMSDLGIIHGLRTVDRDKRYKDFISINTIIRQEVMSIKNVPTNNIYCVLGGGTVNVGSEFTESTLQMGRLCQEVAIYFPKHVIHILCASRNIFDELNKNDCPSNVSLHQDIISPEQYYKDACLIITRSGRNTLSELVYLGIPTISIITGDIYRRHEQDQNIKDLNVRNIQSFSMERIISDFVEVMNTMINLGKQENNFIAGNQLSINKILDI